MKKTHLAKINKKEKVKEGLYKLSFKAKDIVDEIKPGQFINVKINKDNSKILRRPISICDVNNNIVTIMFEVKGEGTKILSTYKNGDIIDFLGPLGNSFPIEKNKTIAIVGGGIGTFPLYFLNKALMKVSTVDTYIGFRDKSCVVMKDEFNEISQNFCLTTDDGSTGFKGFVTEYFQKNISKYDITYACGPQVMLKKVKEICDDKKVKLYVSLEERMGCGIGACLVCACKVKTKQESEAKYKHVCSDGPIFDASELVL